MVGLIRSWSGGCFGKASHPYTGPEDTSMRADRREFLRDGLWAMSTLVGSPGLLASAGEGAADRIGPAAAGPVRLPGRRAGGRHPAHPAAAARRVETAGQRRGGGRDPGAG